MDEFTPDYILDDIIGTLLQYDKQGGFVSRIFEAWQIADPMNKPMMRNLVIFLIEKYHLEEKFNEILEHVPGVKSDSVLFREAHKHDVIIETNADHMHVFRANYCVICTQTREDILKRVGVKA